MTILFNAPSNKIQNPEQHIFIRKTDAQWKNDPVLCLGMQEEFFVCCKTRNTPVSLIRTASK